MESNASMDLANHQAVTPHEVVLPPVHPAVFVGFRFRYPSPFDVGVEVPVPEPFGVGLRGVAHLFVELDAGLQGEGKGARSARRPRGRLGFLPLVGNGHKSPVVFEVLGEPGRSRVVLRCTGTGSPSLETTCPVAVCEAGSVSK